MEPAPKTTPAVNKRLVAISSLDCANFSLALICTHATFGVSVVLTYRDPLIETRPDF